MKNLIFGLGILTLFMSSCATTFLKDSSNVSGVKKDYKKILVIAKSQDNVSRIKFENQVVADFAARGIEAVSSRKYLKNESFKDSYTEREIEEIRRNLVSNGFDGVVVTNLLDVSQYNDVVSGNMGTAYAPVRYGRFGRYYGAYPVNYWEPDRVVSGVEYTLESCFYDISISNADNLQWVGRFKVKDPSSLEDTAIKYATELTTALAEQSISE